MNGGAVQLPFTRVEFLDVFAAYNRVWWPIAVLLWVVSLLAVLRVLQGRPGGSRALAAILAVHWAWGGAIYHLGYFRRINPAAVAFGILFLLQAALLIARGVVRPRLSFASPTSGWGWIGVALILYALTYPGLGVLLGLRYPELPTFGVPCPTTILTAGALLLVPRRSARPAAAATIAWAAIGGSGAFLLGMHADLGLIVAGLVLGLYILMPESSH
jgi:hypothetical protein